MVTKFSDKKNALSIVAYFDDVQRNMSILNEGCERQFLEFVGNTMRWRSQWAAAEVERSSLLSSNRNLEVRLEQARFQLDREQNRLRRAMEHRRMLEEKCHRNEDMLEMLRDCLNHRDDFISASGILNSCNGRRSEDVAMLRNFLRNGSRGAEKACTSSYRSQVSAAPLDARLSNGQNERSAGSILDSGEISEDDAIDANELSYLRNGKMWKRESSMSHLRREFDVEADLMTSTNETPNTSYQERSPVCTVVRPQQHVREAGDFISHSATDLGHEPARRKRRSEDSGDSFFGIPIKRAVQEEYATQQKNSNQINTSDIDIEQTYSPTLARTPSARLKRGHQWWSKTVLNLDKCCVCGKRFGFNRTCMKCSECRTSVHPHCKEAASVPCVGAQGSTPGALAHPVASDGCGGQLADYCGSDRPRIPPLVVHCVAEIERRALTQQGIYRLSGSEKQVRELYGRFMRGRAVPQLGAVDDIHVICSCLKMFLRSISEPLVTYAAWQALRGAAEQNLPDMACATVRALPCANRDTLAFFLLHLQAVAAQSARNLMSADNLSRVFAPTLVGHSSAAVQPMDAVQEAPVQQRILQLLFSLSADFYTELLADAATPVVSTVEEDDESDGSSMLGPAQATPTFQPQLSSAWSKKKFFPEPHNL